MGVKIEKYPSQRQGLLDDLVGWASNFKSICSHFVVWHTLLIQIKHKIKANSDISSDGGGMPCIGGGDISTSRSENVFNT
jgi:hypothetical protein